MWFWSQQVCGDSFRDILVEAAEKLQAIERRVEECIFMVLIFTFRDFHLTSSLKNLTTILDKTVQDQLKASVLYKCKDDMNCSVSYNKNSCKSQRKYR